MSNPRTMEPRNEHNRPQYRKENPVSSIAADSGSDDEERDSKRNLFTLCSTVPGYWFTVALIDRIGRFAIQILGFFMMAVFVFALAFPYNHWTRKDNHIGFVIMYSLTFFFAITSRIGRDSVRAALPMTAWVELESFLGKLCCRGKFQSRKRLNRLFLEVRKYRARHHDLDGVYLLLRVAERQR
ncbi:hypothetical protein U1Q18_027749 [Sarracenia purpurea var. burkii]